VLSKLGFPNVDVEITEDQWEVIWRIAGDFIASYFPREQKLATFYTSPLKPTYPLPKDAYWVQSVNWDPVTTRIGDIFGAESFLFCLAPNFKILDKDGQLQFLGDWKNDWKARTPYGSKALQIVKHNNSRQLPKVRLIYENGVVEATNNHVLMIGNGRWREFGEIIVGDKLNGLSGLLCVNEIEYFHSTDAIGVRSGSGVYYGCLEGEPILIH
jgi:hypothetical protein